MDTAAKAVRSRQFRAVFRSSVELSRPEVSLNDALQQVAQMVIDHTPQDNGDVCYTMQVKLYRPTTEQVLREAITGLHRSVDIKSLVVGGSTSSSIAQAVASDTAVILGNCAKRKNRAAQEHSFLQQDVSTMATLDLRAAVTELRDRLQHYEQDIEMMFEALIKHSVWV